MAIITDAGSLGRIVLPFTAGLLSLTGTFIEGTILCTISMTVIVGYYIFISRWKQKTSVSSPSTS